MTTTLIGGRLSAFIAKFKNWNPMSSRKISPSESTTRVFYGKPIQLETALEETHRLVDYYEALKNGRALPQKPHVALDYLLRCNAITSLYYTTQNLQLRGIGFKNWALTNDQVVYTWLFAHKCRFDKPLICLGAVRLLFKSFENEE